MLRKPTPVISLFSGAMGLDLGLEAAGFEVAAALECDPHAAETIRVNRPNLSVIQKKLEDVTTKEILGRAGLKAGGDFVVVGGPSCQAFSTAGRRESLGDAQGRGGLFREFIRVVRESRPRFFVMENVRGLLSAAIKHRTLLERGPGYPGLRPDEELGSALRLVITELRALGYYVTFDLLNTADYGVPQTRQRLVFIGSRDGENIRIPPPTHSASGKDDLSKWVTLRTALKGLKEKEPAFYNFAPGKAKYLKLVPEGGNWRDLPEKMKEEALGKAFSSWGGRSGFFRRLSWNKPSPALTTRPDSKATILCHPTELRPLTVGEYARIQQFPDSWRFSGTVREQYKQVGNAVPLGLGQAIGLAIKKAMASRRAQRTLGIVECNNLKLVTNLINAHITRLNPPRMRQDGTQEALSGWFAGRKRLRGDALELASSEVMKALAKIS
jgi:DNA (cytosine-5)-methyltransferase 1